MSVSVYRLRKWNSVRRNSSIGFVIMRLNMGSIYQDMKGKAMNYPTENSRALFERSLKSLVEGGSSPSRGPANYGEYPLFIERGEGAYIYDADGNRYVDWMMAYGALPLGHAHPSIVEAVSEAVSTGSLFAAATRIEVEVAELIQEMVPCAERVRFANTGTEAAMAAIRLARGYMGKPMFIKFEGHYHGWFDDFLVNVHPHPIMSLGHRNDPIRIADSSGLNRRALEDTILLPWNDLEAVERAIGTYRGQIAAIITDQVDFALTESRYAAMEVEKSTLAFRIHFRYKQSNYVKLLAYNNRNPVLRNSDIRKALTYAIDRNYIIQKLLNQSAYSADGPLSRESDLHAANLDALSRRYQ